MMPQYRSAAARFIRKRDEFTGISIELFYSAW